MYAFQLADFDGMDGHDLLGVLFVAGPEHGKFEFQIDTVEFTSCHELSRNLLSAGDRRKDEDGWRYQQLLEEHQELENRDDYG